MITPFADEYHVVENAIREVFESAPYFFEVVLARDFMYESYLLENIRAHIEAADAFIAEISDLNSNVMLELGAVLIKNDNARPVFLLRREGAGKDVPADIRAALYIPYSATSAGVDAIAADVRKAIERNGQPHHREIVSILQQRTCLGLTTKLLVETRLNAEERKAIQSCFSTVEQFLAAPTDEVAYKIRLSPMVVRFAQDQIRATLVSLGILEATSG
jgi:hypothetical protein